MRLRVLCSLLALALNVYAQGGDRDQRLRDDLNFVATQLPTLHANFFYQLSRDDFNSAVAKLNADIPNLRTTDFYVRLTAIVAMAGDAHTSIYLSGTNAASVGFQELGVGFRYLDDGIFVTSAAQPYSQALGTRLVRVGEVPAEDVMAKLATVISHQNDQWVRYYAEQYLRGQQILEGLGIVPPGSTTAMTFRTLGGDEFTLDVAPTSAPNQAPNPYLGPLPLYQQRASENYWFTYLTPVRLLYFKYNRCANTPGYPFTAFASDLFRTFDANPVRAVVIDLRGNTGGDSSVMNPFFNGFSSRIGVLANRPDLRFYGIIDKGTFSSGLLNAMQLKAPVPTEVLAQFPGLDESRLVRLLGEPTGGAPSGYGNVKPFTLPRSGLVGQYSTQYFRRPDFIPDLPSLMPDIAVPLRSTDFFARHDPVLASIIAGWEGPPQAPSGDVIAVNGASFRIEQGLAPSSFASGFGNFSKTPDGVTVNGKPATFSSGNTGQVNFIVPAGTQTGRASIAVLAGQEELARGEATITTASPGIFILHPADPAQPGAVLNQDYSVNSDAVRAARGSVIQIYGTGYGPLDASGSAPVQVLIGETAAEVLYSGPTPQYAGLWQINARLPAALSGQVAVFIVANGMRSNGVTVWIE